MRYVMAAGRGLCLASAGAALVAVIVSGASALSYGQNDGALVAAFFGALVALAGSVWICVRLFKADGHVPAEAQAQGAVQVQAQVPARPAWYTGPAHTVTPATALPLPSHGPRAPAWGPYRGQPTADEAATSPEPETPTMADTQRIVVTIVPRAEPPADTGDTRPMKAVRPVPMADTQRIQPTPSAPHPVTPPQDVKPSQPDSLPESPGPQDAEPPVRPSKLAL